MQRKMCLIQTTSIRTVKVMSKRPVDEMREEVARLRNEGLSFS